MSSILNDRLTPLSPDDRIKVIALALTQRVGLVLMERLLVHFGSLDSVLNASIEELRAVSGIGAQIAASIKGIDVWVVAKSLERYETQGITVLTWLDAGYPARLSALADKPAVIFMRGQIMPQDDFSVAIVGTRDAVPESIQTAAQWAGDLARQGWTVNSGLARGIDTAAHRGALDASGRSIAVLGSGINAVYPPENGLLASQIIHHGALLSEVAPNSAPSPNALARRNRLITALSRAVIVVEAGETSGALIAARSASEQGLPVYAINNSEGNAALLADFAQELPSDAATLIARIG